MNLSKIDNSTLVVMTKGSYYKLSQDNTRLNDLVKSSIIKNLSIALTSVVSNIYNASVFGKPPLATFVCGGCYTTTYEFHKYMKTMNAFDMRAINTSSEDYEVIVDTNVHDGIIALVPIEVFNAMQNNIDRKHVYDNIVHKINNKVDEVYGKEVVKQNILKRLVANSKHVRIPDHLG